MDIFMFENVRGVKHGSPSRRAEDLRKRGINSAEHENFGLERLIIVNPRYEPDDDVYGFAMHARDIVDSAEIIQDGRSTPDVLTALRDGFDTMIGTTAKSSNYMKLYRVPVDIRDWLAQQEPGSFSPCTALVVFGREDNGLTDEEMRLCDIMVTISANPDTRP